MSIIHEPRKRDDGHRCQTPGTYVPGRYSEYKYRKGTVWQCGECGAIWYVDQFHMWCKANVLQRFWLRRKAKVNE